MQLQTLRYRFTIGPSVINRVGTQVINHRGRGTEIARKRQKPGQNTKAHKNSHKRDVRKRDCLPRGRGDNETRAQHIWAGQVHRMGGKHTRAGSAGPETRQEVSINIKQEVHETMKHENSKGNLTRGRKTQRCLT